MDGTVAAYLFANHAVMLKRGTNVAFITKKLQEAKKWAMKFKISN